MATRYVTLNVGGKLYLTERSTLRCSGSFFLSLMDNDDPSSVDKEGHYLLNRDGEIFRHVLNFLRCRKLVLPDGFSEYDLLQCEAEFFKLGELKKAIQARIQEETGGAIGLRVGGKTFRMTTEEASKEQDSFFAKMLSGQISVPRDSLGNFVIDRDQSMFRLVLRYLKDGGIVINITSKELACLKKEGEYFGLQMLVHHINSVQFMQQEVVRNSKPLYLHLFYRDNCDGDESVVYANRAKLSGWFTDWLISDICSEHHSFLDGRFAGFIDDQKVMAKIDKMVGLPITKRDIITHIRDRMGGNAPEENQLKDEWRMAMFST